MPIVAGPFKLGIGESRQNGLYDRQFADPGVIVGDPGIANVLEAGPRIALARADLPAAAGRGEQRIGQRARHRSEEHTSELQALMRISYAVFCLKKKKTKTLTISLHYTARNSYPTTYHQCTHR